MISFATPVSTYWAGPGYLVTTLFNFFRYSGYIVSAPPAATAAVSRFHNSIKRSGVTMGKYGWVTDVMGVGEGNGQVMRVVTR